MKLVLWDPDYRFWLSWGNNMTTIMLPKLSYTFRAPSCITGARNHQSCNTMPRHSVTRLAISRPFTLVYLPKHRQSPICTMQYICCNSKQYHGPCRTNFVTISPYITFKEISCYNVGKTVPSFQYCEQLTYYLFIIIKNHASVALLGYVLAAHSVIFDLFKSCY